MDLRYGNFVYEIPAALGDYDVTLWFADPLSGAGPGARSFDVNINGTVALSAFDVIAAAGAPLRSVSRTFRVQANGNIRIQFTTVTRNAIVNAIEVLPVPSPPSINCPEPILSLRDSRTLIVGASWTPGTPCFVHQNITLAVDPLLIQTLTAPIEVRLKPGQTTTDDVYLTLTSPTRAAPARLKILGAGAALATTFETSPLYDLQAHAAPRVFPPGSSPVGLAFIRSGVWSLPLHGFLGKMPLYIDGTVPLAVLSENGGFRFVLNPQAVQQAALRLQQERTAALMQVRSAQLLTALAEAQEAILRTGALRNAKQYLDTVEALRAEMQDVRVRQDLQDERREIALQSVIEQALAASEGQARMRLEQAAMETEGQVLDRLRAEVGEARALLAQLEELRKPPKPVIRLAVGGAPQ
jgi:hypothetical protein